jgi:hypothetical protein
VDPAILKGAAAALNTFSSDGSFMDSFQAQGKPAHPSEPQNFTPGTSPPAPLFVSPVSPVNVLTLLQHSFQAEAVLLS